MAGLNLETKLDRLFKPENLTKRAGAYGFALIAGAGAWLVLLASMLLIRGVFLATEWISPTTANLFATAVAYCFIFGQMINALGQFVAARFASDELYAKRADRLMPALVGWLKVQLALAVLAAGAYWLLFQPSAAIALAMLVTLAATVSLFSLNLFAAMVDSRGAALGWLSAGMGIAIVSALICGMQQWWLGGQHGVMLTLVLCFALGLVVCDLGLTSRLLKKLPLGSRAHQYDLLLAVDAHKPLMIASTGYALGLWSANLIYWLAAGQSLGGIFQVNMMYDTATFFGYLLITPVYMLLFVAIETRFFPYYRRLMSQINNGGTLEAIETSQVKLRGVLVQELIRIIRTQAIITVIAVVFVGIQSSRNLYFTLETSVLQLVIVGACLNSFVLVVLLLQLYLDDQRGAAITGGLFGLTVIVATLAGLPLGIHFYGIGLIIGALIAVVVGLVNLLRYADRLSEALFLKSAEHTPGRIAQVALAYVSRHTDRPLQN